MGCIICTDTIIFGCGNVLLGDDGFGPAVIEALHDSCLLPDHVQALDAGTGIREYLIDYALSSIGRPQSILVLDAVDCTDYSPGELVHLDPASIPARKIHDFSLHQFPTVNLLQELNEETGIDVSILAAQVEKLPDQVAPGLSPAMQDAVDRAFAQIIERFEGDLRQGSHLLSRNLEAGESAPQ